MSEEKVGKEIYLGASLEEYPKECQTCHALADLVDLLGNPDLSNWPLYPLPDHENYRKIARMVFPNIGNCTVNDCGLERAQALQQWSDLE